MGRLSIAIHALRGRPTMYRMRVIDGAVTLAHDSKSAVVECTFVKSKPTLRQTILQCRDLLLEWWRLRN